MIEYHNSRAARIIGPHREVLDRDSLPPPNTTRWVASRKAQVVAAVQGGLLTLEEVMARYNLSLEEFYAWQRAMDRAGVSGLRVAWSSADRAARRRDRPQLPIAVAERRHLVAV
ncbi:uncharacterized protein DUF1153 [Novosphingobium kunmingense]|uniref:Uncharacterized protein DUF1153 n=1 Tax=Novosphingobium kunmingense TaxID=1211806 RepID=A0A2N0I1S1_9SPHN|nr:DUF1153 domain-containing protein [Novosphingobium kunmingense]PKB25121.1 uncharacterized protein DUF1153 [Novosphingobium kunmingense]